MFKFCVGLPISEELPEVVSLYLGFEGSDLR